MRSLVVFLVVCGAIVGCRAPCKQNLPPASTLMHPGPGVDGPGPGVMTYQQGVPAPGMTSQLYFVGPDGMSVTWDVATPGAFDSAPLTCPGRYNFPQGAIYRVKLTNIPGRSGIELYPTVEVGPVMPRTEAFLAHNAIPVEFTPEDFDQVLSGNFVTKVIYLPDPEFQELALAGVGTLVSTRLDPGVDPVVEADRRGAIMAIVRLGNKDLQMPGARGQEGDISTASYQDGEDCPQGQSQAAPVPMGAPVGTPSTAPMSYVSGVNGPQYGMPMCGTPIGLPGPPSVPMGVPAGLQKHTIKNHTRVHLPEPTKNVQIDVKQTPGISYPAPASRARIVERTSPGVGYFKQPLGNRRERVNPDCQEQQCQNGEQCPSDGQQQDSGDGQQCPAGE